MIYILHGNNQIQQLDELYSVHFRIHPHLQCGPSNIVSLTQVIYGATLPPPPPLSILKDAVLAPMFDARSRERHFVITPFDRRDGIVSGFDSPSCWMCKVSPRITSSRVVSKLVFNSVGCALQAIGKPPWLQSDKASSSTPPASLGKRPCPGSKSDIP